VNASKPYGPAGIGQAPGRRHMCRAVQWFLSPHPGPLPWGEGELDPTQSTIQTIRLSAARGALFPLPEGEGQGEGKRRGHNPVSRSISGTDARSDSSGKAGGFPS
jgi:hypothetical protein